MVLHSIACRICSAKCDEHSGRVCKDCARRIKDIQMGRMGLREFTPLRTEAQKHRQEVESA